MSFSLRRMVPWAAWVLFAAPAIAQAPSVALVPNYKPGAHFLYSLHIHSSISTRATLDTVAEVEMQILPGSGLGRFRAAARFTHFSTTVKAESANDQAALEVQSAATDKAAVSMQPAQFEVSSAGLQILARTPGADYDQPVDMLEELIRTDSLPTGAVSVGSRWTRARSRAIPGMNASVPLTMDCSLASLGTRDGAAVATIQVQAHGEAVLPPDALPGAAALEAQGVVPDAHVSVATDSSAVYRAADAVLLEITSQSHNQLQIKLIGGPQPQSSTTDSTSSATVKLEKIFE
ncbi:MAG: hypothetical protein ACRD2D_03340 [Terriglobales bacterium]